MVSLKAKFFYLDNAVYIQDRLQGSSMGNKQHRAHERQDRLKALQCNTAHTWCTCMSARYP